MDINSNPTANELPDLPNEIHSKIFSYLDLTAIQNIREVSKKWKYIVPIAHPNLHFVCQLTDETAKYAVESDEIFSCLEVHDFSGKGNEVVPPTPTSGTGLLFGNIHNIKFVGNNIEAAEIPKMMQFAVDNVKILELKNCGNESLHLFIEAKQTFTALQELTITYTNIPKVNDTLALDGLGAPDLGPVLPSLKRLTISLDAPDYVYKSAQDMFSNYLAIAKLIIKYRRSLKDIEIKRSHQVRSITTGAIVHGRDNFVLSPAQNTELQRCLESFQEMTLEKLCVTPENVRHPWVLETESLRRQKHLKEVIIEGSVHYISSSELPDLTTWLPGNRATLTSIKITLFELPTNTVDLGAFRDCPNLKTLWLNLYGTLDGADGDEDLDMTIWSYTKRFSNVEALPTTISNLLLKCDNRHVGNRHSKHQFYILSAEQMKWMIDNLKDLESLWVQMILEPKNSSNGQPGRAPPQQDASRRPNMTLPMFNDLISLPKLKSLKLDMFKFSQLEASIYDDEEDIEEDSDFAVYVISLGEIQDYLDVCNHVPHITSVSRYPVQGHDIRFWELTIQTSH